MGTLIETIECSLKDNAIDIFKFVENTDLKLSIKKDGVEKEAKQNKNELFLTVNRAYEEGEVIEFTPTVSGFYVLSFDSSVASSYVYSNGEPFTFSIPFGEKRKCFSPLAFDGNIHYLHVRIARVEEIMARKNLCLNPLDYHGNNSVFPHSYANVETRGESVFASRNAIDGLIANDNHGPWPYSSWGINQDPNAAITIDFNRDVLIDEIGIYLRADFPHDTWWSEGTVSFSDGSEEKLNFIKSGDRQSFKIEPRVVNSLTFDRLIKADNSSPFPALTQIEAFGLEA